MIEFASVSKIYDNGTKALDNVSLKINEGEFVFVVGASGAGKSTFLKLIMKEESTTEGNVFVNGYDLSKIKNKEIPYLRRTMGIIFQDFRLISKMTVYENVAFPMRIIGCGEKKIAKRVNFVLSLVDLQDKAKNYPSELSGGERQRVGLARALVNNPPMIIADEPTGNIDPEMSFEITELLNKINQNGTTVVMVTHEHDLVRQFNKRVIVIENGTVVSDSVSAECEYTEEKHYEISQPEPVNEETAPIPDDDINVSGIIEELSDKVSKIHDGVSEKADSIEDTLTEAEEIDEAQAENIKERAQKILSETQVADAPDVSDKKE